MADAAHLDGARAPSWLKVIRKPHKSSTKHWVFQEKCNQPISQGDRLLFTSVPFGADEAEAWWLCFDALQLLDRELSDVDSILADSKRKQFAMRGVQGAGQADRLCKWLQTDGWLPVDTRIRVSDVASLARELGGEQLYGRNRLVPLRELLQNASDAIRARSFLQSWPPERGEVIVRVGADKEGHFVEVIDNGVGMSPTVMASYLLDFGRSFWSDSQLSEELPGLLASGFESTGKYGIGFFSVFMWSKHIRVISRRYRDSQADTHVLEFAAGLESRPLLRKATGPECLQDGGTVIRVWVEQDPEAPGGVLHFPRSSGRAAKRSLAVTCLWICPALDTNLFVQHGNESKNPVLHASDWTSVSDEELIRRVVTTHSDTGDEIEQRRRTDELLMALASMLRPLYDGDGNLVGRMALIPSRWRNDWSAFGVVTVGGLRSASLTGVAGLLLGSSTRASRDAAVPVVPLPQLQVWAREQESLVVAETEDPEALLECASTVRVCGPIPEILPIAEGHGGLKTAAQIRKWRPIPSEVILVQDASLALLRRKFGKIDLFPNVLAVNVGLRSLVCGDYKRPFDSWPPDIDRFHDLTLMGAAAQLVAELWGVPSGDLMKFLDKARDRVAIGMSGDKEVRTSAAILRKSGPSAAKR
ncbi:MAG: ATP-binding protein [Acidobacteriia bacterium]|nr:ATP-binding protein [Terriglobia bacterium]